MLASAVTLLLAIAASAPQGLPERPAITVSAAVSLTDALTAAAQEFARAGGGTIRFNFGASNVLARQIVNGAPVDLFISADAAQMDLVPACGAVDAKTRVPLLSNRRAVAT